jgi:hypothetical protein
MKPYHNNPRRISDKQLADLSTWLAELGDLSGIVHDLNSDQVIGGNQRSKVFDVNACEIVLTEQYANPDEQGTVALGYILWQGNKYAYRQVRWDERQCESANVIANRAGGEWDFELLAQNFMVDDLLAWGFEPVELNGMVVPSFEPVDESEQPRLDQRSPITCPYCQMEFIPK